MGVGKEHSVCLSLYLSNPTPTICQPKLPSVPHSHSKVLANIPSVVANFSSSIDGPILGPVIFVSNACRRQDFGNLTNRVVFVFPSRLDNCSSFNISTRVAHAGASAVVLITRTWSSLVPAPRLPQELFAPAPNVAVVSISAAAFFSLQSQASPTHACIHLNVTSDLSSGVFSNSSSPGAIPLSQDATTPYTQTQGFLAIMIVACISGTFLFVFVVRATCHPVYFAGSLPTSNNASVPNIHALFAAKNCVSEVDRAVANLVVRSYHVCTEDEKSTTREAFDDAGVTKGDGCDACVICLVDFVEGEEISGLPCFHAFHRMCIVPWIYENPTCPLCKKRIYEMPASAPVAVETIV
jgi:hypothetical protein